MLLLKMKSLENISLNGNNILFTPHSTEPEKYISVTTLTSNHNHNPDINYIILEKLLKFYIIYKQQIAIKPKSKSVTHFIKKYLFKQK